VAEFQRAHRQWVAYALLHDTRKRDERWSEALAVGSQAFIAKVKQELSLGARHRDVEEADGIYALREPPNAYRCDFGTENAALRVKNAVFSAHNPVNT